MAQAITLKILKAYKYATILMERKYYLKLRKKLICGVSGSAIGFSETDSEGNSTGFDADYCRVVAAAALGDATAVEFRDLTAAERFEALKNGEVDVLVRNSTWTQGRDADIGVQFASTTYYDGQQILASTTAFPGLTTDSGIPDIDGATVCVNAGTTTLIRCFGDREEQLPRLDCRLEHNHVTN